MDQAHAHEWLKAIWPHLSQEELLGGDYNKFTQFIASQLATSSPRRTGTNSQLISVTRELDALEVGFLTKERAYAAVHKVLPSDSQLVHTWALELVFRIMFTLDFQVGPLERHLHTSIRPDPIIQLWDKEICLSEAVASHFSCLSSSSFNIKTRRIEPNMTMAYLNTHRGFTVCWTSNLADHLTINWKSRVLSVYEHKIYLWNHLNSRKAHIISHEILEEAIDTLNVLFPLNDVPTKAFLRKSGRSFYGLGYCKRERCCDLAKFQIWRDRMADLIDVMNEEPKGVQQLTLSTDGRNLLSFMTFWIACAVAFLSIISIAFGTVQTIYSIKQYNLAVAQACSTPGAMALSQYCL